MGSPGQTTAKIFAKFGAQLKLVNKRSVWIVLEKTVKRARATPVRQRAFPPITTAHQSYGSDSTS
jgi:hypothetical protein